MYRASAAEVRLALFFGPLCWRGDDRMTQVEYDALILELRLHPLLMMPNSFAELYDAYSLHQDVVNSRDDYTEEWEGRGTHPGDVVAAVAPDAVDAAVEEHEHREAVRRWVRAHSREELKVFQLLGVVQLVALCPDSAERIRVHAGHQSATVVAIFPDETPAETWQAFKAFCRVNFNRMAMGGIGFDDDSTATRGATFTEAERGIKAAARNEQWFLLCADHSALFGNAKKFGHGTKCSRADLKVLLCTKEGSGASRKLDTTSDIYRALDWHTAEHLGPGIRVGTYAQRLTAAGKLAELEVASSRRDDYDATLEKVLEKVVVPPPS